MFTLCVACDYKKKMMFESTRSRPLFFYEAYIKISWTMELFYYIQFCGCPGSLSSKNNKET